jgi:hypothetical protein
MMMRMVANACTRRARPFSIALVHSGKEQDQATTSPAEQQRSAAAPHGQRVGPPSSDERQPEQPPTPSGKGSRPDRDPFPSPNPSLTRAAGAGLDDESYRRQSGATAGSHTPGKTAEADESPPPTTTTTGGDEEDEEQQQQQLYPLERDPSVSGGMAKKGPPSSDQCSPPHQEEKEVSLPPNPAAASCAGPYASRPDRDPWPAPMPCLSRAAGAGLDDIAFAGQSGAVAGSHTPGAHHFEGVTDVEDDDHVAPPPREPLEMSDDDARFCYPLDRDPSVGGGMATAAHLPPGAPPLPAGDV